MRSKRFSNRQDNIKSNGFSVTPRKPNSLPTVLEDEVMLRLAAIHAVWRLCLTPCQPLQSRHGTTYYRQVQIFFGTSSTRYSLVVANRVCTSSTLNSQDGRPSYEASAGEAGLWPFANYARTDILEDLQIANPNPITNLIFRHPYFVSSSEYECLLHHSTKRLLRRHDRNQSPNLLDPHQKVA